ncbi:hypothetical protein [Ruegeria lacuscaerulensis]|nr:hypothetical protein [Ruegeria lacuscaerulensis]
MNDDEFSDEEIFGRPLQDMPLDDLIAEIQSRSKEDTDARLTLLATV